MAGEDRRVEIIFDAVDRGVSHTVSNITSALKDGLAGAAVAVGAAFATAIGGAVVVLKELTDAGAEAQLSQARFNALVDSSSLADYKNEMLEFADALSKVTRFEDENILEAEAMLATYDTIGRETFPAVLDATLDLAEFMKTDATSAAQTLGRAFADIEGGSLSLLKRSRLLTAEQVEMAEKMAKAGDVAGAQALVIEALDGKIGDLAETMGQTFEGQKTIFLNALNDIKEDLGMKLLPILTPVLQKFGDLAEKYAPMIFEAFDTYIIPAFEGGIDIFTKFLDALDKGNLVEFFEGVDWAGIGNTIRDSLLGMSESFKEWSRSVDWQEVSDNISKGIASVDWSRLGTDVRHFSANIWKGISEAVEEIDWSQIGDALADGLNNTLAGMTGQGDVDNVIKTWTENILQALNVNVQLTAIGLKKGKEFSDALGRGLIGGLPMILTQISSWIVPIEDTLGLIKKVFFNAFQGAAQQAIVALSGMRSSVMKAVQNFMDSIRAIVGKGIQMAVTVSIPSLAAFARMAATLAAGKAMLQAALSGGNASKGAQVGSNAGTFAGGGGSVGGGVTPHYASGTNSAKKGWAIVGEEGPELVNFGGGETVLSNKASSKAGNAGGGMGGGGMIVNLTYAPTFSTASQAEFMENITPILDTWYRRRLAS